MGSSKSPKPPPPPPPPAPPVERKDVSAQVDLAKAQTKQKKGYQATILTSALGGTGKDTLG